MIAVNLLAVILTSGTCGVYSPDGAKIAVQRVEDGKSRVGVWERADGRFAWVEPGSGNAAYPAWSPAGDALVYTYGNETNTAWAAKDGTTGYHLRIWRNDSRRDGGSPCGGGIREITGGRFRDYMPSFAPDGKRILFVSTRCASPKVGLATRSGVYAVGIDGGGLTNLVPSMVNDMGAGQPVVSPDGRILAFAQIDNFRDTWHLVCARTDDPSRGCRVTPKGQSAYAPRWTPDGRHLVYTGFTKGDPGWCVYVLDPRTGATRRICEGRNPDVHPSGKWLLYDDGTNIHERPFGADDLPSGAPPDEMARNEPVVEPTHVIWRAEKPAYPATVPMDKSFVFGTTRTFFVRAKIRFKAAKEPRFRHYVTGAYDGAPLGFELFVDHDTPKFGAREASGLYMGAVSDIRLEDGKEYVLTGVRTHDRLIVRVDENRPCEFRFSATYPLDRPLKMSVGPTLGGTGEILWAEVGTGWPRGLPRPATRHEIFAGGSRSCATDPKGFAGGSRSCATDPKGEVSP